MWIQVVNGQIEVGSSTIADRCLQRLWRRKLVHFRGDKEIAVGENSRNTVEAEYAVLQGFDIQIEVAHPPGKWVGRQ